MNNLDKCSYKAKCVNHRYRTVPARICSQGTENSCYLARFYEAHPDYPKTTEEVLRVSAMMTPARIEEDTEAIGYEAAHPSTFRSPVENISDSYGNMRFIDGKFNPSHQRDY